MKARRRITVAASAVTAAALLTACSTGSNSNSGTGSGTPASAAPVSTTLGAATNGVPAAITAAGGSELLTTAKPVHTLKDEPMEFATFDDGHGLVETVLFPDIYRERGHVLFDQGPFIFRGKVEEEFGAVTVTITKLDRLERVSRRTGASR